MKKRVVFLSLLLLLTLMPSYGATLDDKKSELNDTKETIEAKEAQIEKKKQEQNTLYAEMKQLDEEMVVIEGNIADLEVQLEEKAKQIEESQKNLEEANVKKEEQYEDTKTRMVQMYKNQKTGYMQVVLASDNFWEAINRAEYVKRISTQDNNLLDEYKKQIVVIEEHTEKIQKEEAELDDLQLIEVSKQADLATKQEQKKETMGRLKNEEGQLATEIDALEEASVQLEADIKKILAEMEAAARVPMKYTGGAFLWPVPGYYRISSEYNPRNSPISGNYEFHTGIDIPAGYGEDVVAAADGVVITSGWVNGYGYTIMISHGSGLVSLYGHNSSLVVENGQTVSRGQVIAKIGSTGYSTGNHCHFEVRVNGSHTSPWNYLNN